MTVRSAFALALSNVPSLAFLAACMWFVARGHVGFAVACIMLSAMFHVYVSPKGGAS